MSYSYEQREKERAEPIWVAYVRWNLQVIGYGTWIECHIMCERRTQAYKNAPGSIEGMLYKMDIGGGKFKMQAISWDDVLYAVTTKEKFKELKPYSELDF